MSVGNPDGRRLREELAAQAKIEFPAELPVSARAAEIRELWRNHPVIIVGGATGSGKTTQLPKIALQLGGGRAGRIGCTQPRRIAAQAMARRLACELGAGFGAGVGCQVRFEDRTSEATYLKFMTDGILLAETRNDRELRQYDTLIVDEAHERSLNIDFLLGYLKNLLARRSDLRVAISSATLDTEQFSAFFGGAPVVSVEGRAYPVEDFYLLPEPDEELSDHVARAINFLTELDPRGDILVFLPGEREIRETAELLTGRGLRQTEILPLYARLSSAEQQRVFQPGRLRRVVLATNVAETSLTIPGIRYCIDSGLARVSRYNPRTRIQELQVEMISQAAARQRRGRCGRTADGICVHLYSEDDLKRSAPYTDPEIRRTSLAGVILQMAALRLPRIEHFPFLDPPPAALIREGRRTLIDLRALTPSDRITTDGWLLAALPVDPHLGRMLLAAGERGVLAELLVVVANLSINDPRERPSEKQQAADLAHRQFRDENSDFQAILNLWNALEREASTHSALRRFCRSHFLHYNRVREWRNLVADLAESYGRVRKVKVPVPGCCEQTPYDALHESLLAGIPRNLALYDHEYRHYLGTDGRKFYIFPGSGLFSRRKPPEWLLAFSLVETSRVFARQVAEIKPEYLERVAPHLCSRVYDQAHYEPRSGFVRARERLTFGGLLIHAGRRVDYGRVRPAEAREIFIREGLLTGVAELPGSWLESFRQTRAELLNWELKLRRPGTVYDEEGAARYFLEKLPPEIHSLAALKRWCSTTPTPEFPPPREVLMQEQYRSFDPADYPDRLRFGGVVFPLSYCFDPGSEEDGVTLRVPESELNLLPAWALDYPPAGYLPELVELLLRSLPREQRRCFSNAAAVTEFLRRRRAGEILAEQPLAEALADFLHDEYQLEVSPRVLAEARRPEHLRLKLAVLDERGRIREVVRELPERAALGSQLSCALPGVREFAATGWHEWEPGPPLPEALTLPMAGREAYPALVDEGRSVGRQLFLKLSEARQRHRAGVLRLFKLAQASQLKFIRNSFRFSNELKLSWLVQDQEKRYLDDLLDSTVEYALGGDLWSIRDREAFATAADRARQELGEAAAARMATLEQLYRAYAAIRARLPQLRARALGGAAELEQHLESLFAPGFLLRPAVWSDYRRYLRGLQLRAERLLNNPARDAGKGAVLAPYLERFELALASVGELTASPELYEFWCLLEECRLAQFAPEVPTAIRAPVSKLEQTWNQLRY